MTGAGSEDEEILNPLFTSNFITPNPGLLVPVWVPALPALRGTNKLARKRQGMLRGREGLCDSSKKEKMDYMLCKGSGTEAMSLSLWRGKDLLILSNKGEQRVMDLFSVT
ncbi:hypothetical protein NDU88_001267 [Pleurodeles waltl]|uniref:Uncharacterized protein n=1 Tax=Pleurodeles waltl TaxID=8319 RepID=A0AAV7MJ85_PLEWA|nr:hypothetical protein NDU88_001267 [Pleurodeles waltl]